MNAAALTYRECAPLLRQLGYAPAAVSPGQSVPIGPWHAVQLDHALFSNADTLAAVLGSVPPAMGPAPYAIENAAGTWLAFVHVAAGEHSVEYAALVEKIGRAPVRVAA